MQQYDYLDLCAAKDQITDCLLRQEIKHCLLEAHKNACDMTYKDYDVPFDYSPDTEQALLWDLNFSLAICTLINNGCSVQAQEWFTMQLL